MPTVTATRCAQEAMGGVKDVKPLGLEDSYIVRFRAPSRRFATTASTSMVVGEAPRCLLEAVAFGGTGASGSSGCWCRATASFPTCARRWVSLPSRGCACSRRCSRISSSLTRMRFMAAMLDDVHPRHAPDLYPPPKPVSATAAPLRLRRRAGVQADVRSAYPFGRACGTRRLTRSNTANTTVGIVGGTRGAGKKDQPSSGLSWRCWTRTRANFSVDGAPGHAASAAQLAGCTPVCAQQIFLVDDTVGANIAFGVRPRSADQAAVERAARLAELHDFVVGEMPRAMTPWSARRPAFRRAAAADRDRPGALS